MLHSVTAAHKTLNFVVHVRIVVGQFSQRRTLLDVGGEPDKSVRLID